MTKNKKVRLRQTPISEGEIISDFLFFFIAFLISLATLYIFDIHWSMHPGQTLIPPSKYVGIEKEVYVIGSLIGAIAGFMIIKLFLVGIKGQLENGKK
jgi:hypothetical protein